MAAEALEIRMARLEGAYQQINERLNDLRLEIQDLRMEVRGEIAGVRTELRAEVGELRRQISVQFYWVLTFVLGSILIPIIRDLAR